MAGNIFINYRRDDDAGFTQALYSRLEQAFPSESLFMDVDNIAPGLDFVQVLNDEVARCDVVIAVIGKNWLGATDETGARRLDNPEDFVRIEIESALAQKKRVIPVLVNDARMPRSTELPETMRAFARCNAVRLTHERFRADVAGLIKSLEQVLSEGEAARQAQGETSRREAKAKEKGEAERAWQERLEERKRSYAKTNAVNTQSPGLWRCFSSWVASLPPSGSWLIPVGVAAIVLIVWRLPVLFYWLFTQGAAALSGLYTFSALLCGAGFLAVLAGVYLRRESLTGPGLALAWFAAASLFSLAAISVLVVIGTRGTGVDILPHSFALVAAAMLVSLRGWQITGLEASVYGIGIALFANGSLASNLIGTGASAAVQLVFALIVACTSLGIVLWRRSRASGPELAVYGLGSAYLLAMALLANLGSSGASS
jgi:hypothetical protein